MAANHGASAGVTGILSLGLNTRGAWDATVTYGQGDVVTSSGVTWQSLQNNNLNQTPASSATWWISLGPGKQFIGRVYGWSRSYQMPSRSRAGRGGPRLEQTRRLNASSVISFRIEGTGVGYPCPAQLYNALGGLVIQYDTGKNVSFTGNIEKYEEDFTQAKTKNDGGGENWDIGVVMRLTAEPVYTGWPGTQVTAPTVNFLDQETDAGDRKTVDPYGLNTRQSRQWDVGTIADTASAETLKAQHFLTSAPLMSSYVQTIGLLSSFAPLIPRTATFDRTDRAGGLVTVEYGVRSTKQDVTYPSTSRRVDPYTLESMATSAVVAPGTIPAATGLTSTVVDYAQLTPGLYTAIKRFAPLNTAQQVIANNSRSTRSAEEFVNDFADVIISSQTDEQEADAQFAVFQNFTNFDHLSVSTLTPTRKLLIVRTKEIGTLVQFDAGNPTGRYLPAVTNSGVIQVYLPQVLNVAGSLKQVRHQSLFYTTKQRMRFTLSWWVTAAAPIEIYLSRVGTVNNATFCGLAAGTVMYLRMRGQANTGLTGNIPQYKTAEFELDQAGFFDYRGYQDDTFFTTAAVVQGWNNVSLFSAGEIAVATPASSDFSVFG